MHPVDASSRRLPASPGKTPAGTVRIGILGCSDIAERKFLPALLRSPRAILSAVASRDLGRTARWCARSGGVPCTYDKLVRGGTADLVYLSLPNHLHEEWVLRALAGGMHVLCEKPLGLTVRSVQRMVNAARERGLLLAENLMFLRHPQHGIVRELIASGAVGPVRGLRTSYGFPLADPDNFRMDPTRGGGAFHDLIRYPLGMAQFLLQGPVVRAHGFRRVRDGLTVAVHAWAVTGETEMLSLSVGFDQQYECFYEVVGEQGVIRLDRAYTPPADLANTVHLTIGSERTTVMAPAADQFQLMLDHVIGQLASEPGREELYRGAAELARAAELVRQGCEEVPAP